MLRKYPIIAPYPHLRTYQLVGCIVSVLRTLLYGSVSGPGAEGTVAHIIILVDIDVLALLFLILHGSQEFSVTVVFEASYSFHDLEVVFSVLRMLVGMLVSVRE